MINDILDKAEPVNLPKEKKEKIKDETKDLWIRIDARNYTVTVSPELGELALSDSKYMKIDQAKFTEKVDRKVRSSTDKKGFTLVDKKVDVNRHYLVLTGQKTKPTGDQDYWLIRNRRNGAKPKGNEKDTRPIYYSVKLKKSILDEIDTKLSSTVKGIKWREFTVLEENIKKSAIAFELNNNKLINIIANKKTKE